MTDDTRDRDTEPPEGDYIESADPTMPRIDVVYGQDVMTGDCGPYTFRIEREREQTSRATIRKDGRHYTELTLHHQLTERDGVEFTLEVRDVVAGLIWSATRADRLREVETRPVHLLIPSGDWDPGAPQPEDSADLQLLREAIDAADIWRDDEQRESGDYVGAVAFMAERIAELEAENAKLRNALRFSSETLSSIAARELAGHEGDDESGEHFEDCMRCAADAAIAQAEDALSKGVSDGR